MTYRSETLLKQVRKLGCVECGRPVQAAHSNLIEHGKGKGIKASDAAIMALCPEHHFELDNGKAMTKEQRRAFTFEAIAKTHSALLERGLIAPQP